MKSPKISSRFSKSVILATVVLTAITATADTTHRNPSNLGSGLVSGHEMSDEELETMMAARSQQNAYFLKLQEDIMNGVPVDTASGACTYISAIFVPPTPKSVVLTFDDGPSAELTPRVLDTLKKYNIKATFFQLGKNAENNKQIVSRVKAEGHLVASHSYSHANFHQIGEHDQVGQITGADHALSPFYSAQKLFRYPYGNSTCSSNALLKKMGYSGAVGWHVDSCDWAFSRSGSVSASQARICEVAPQNTSDLAGHVLAEVRKRNGGIVLMHDVHVRTEATLETVIVRLLKEGYTFTNLDNPQTAAYYK